MIKEMNLHYSFTTPASIHDEEALTALELAGRQGAKINEVIRDQNALRKETETHMDEQDNRIAEKFDEQDNRIAEKFDEQDARLTKQENEQIPETVTAEIKKNIDNGTFEREIDYYAGGLTDRVDELLGSMTEGSTTMDAEIIDARLGADGTNYVNVGTALRKQLHAGGRLMSDVLYKMSKNIFDISKQPYTIVDNPYYYLTGIPYTETDGVSASFFSTNLFELQPETEYTIGLVPNYGVQSKPWDASTYGIFFYDAGGNYLAGSYDATFTTPKYTKYARFNVQKSTGLTYIEFISRCIIVKGNTLPSFYEPYRVKFLDDLVEEQTELVKELTDIVRPASLNLYDPSLQTEATIEPHYYWNGYPYETTDFDDKYNCTALIPVEGNTQYTIGLVPAVGGYTKPWAVASGGVMMYDASGAYLGTTANETFITPITAAHIRFNFYKTIISLDELNAKCMIVKGDTLPDVYEGYGNNDPFNFENGKLFYNVTEDSVIVNAHYDAKNDITFCLKRGGGNNIFDFKKIGIIANDSKTVTKKTDTESYIFNGTTDWFAPYIMRALNNVDGDQTAQHFTGGNHDYTNTGSGGTPTGRTISIRAFADGKEITGTGTCDMIRIEWTNRVQAYNTKKADGSGREVLEERHTLIFDGEKWCVSSELEPLEDIYMIRYYGLQCSGTSTVYKNIRFIGCDKRGLFSGTEDNTSGQPDTIGLVGYGDDHKIIMEIDPTYDLGKRYMIGENSGVFTASYGKSYNNLILSKQLNKGDVYRFKGAYTFKPV